MSRMRFGLGLAIVLAAAGVLHGAALRAPFFADDWLFLDQVRAHSLGTVLASPDPIGNFFRPLGRQVWFWLWGALGRESPLPFHAANLVLLLGALVLLARITRRLAGPAAGVLASAFLALHYAVDVPVRWASGCQELLALALGLASLDAYLAGKRWLAAAGFVLALLSKESIVVLPLVAVALDPKPRPFLARARAAWPLAVAGAAWLAFATWATLRRGTPGAGLALTAEGPLAVPVQLVRVILGIEWPTGGASWLPTRDPGASAWLALVLALAGVLLAWPPREAAAARTAGSKRKRADARSRRTRPDRAVAADEPAPASAPPPAALPPRRALWAGLAWVLAGAAPVVVVAPLWSAYYFLFALAGSGFLLGALLAARPRPAFVALLVLAVLGWGSAQARKLEEFATAPSAWSGQSHVNRFYLNRGMTVVGRVVDDLRRQAPSVEPRTTFFYAGIPSFAAVQVADGPLVRSVYRDSSLKSYFLSQITRERLHRGPRKVFFFDHKTGRLEDKTGEPDVLLSITLGLVLSDRMDVAEATLEAAGEERGDDRVHRYVSALVAVDRGDTARAREHFSRSGVRLGRDGSAALRLAFRQLTAVDTVGAIGTLRQAVAENVLDAELHGLLADVLLQDPESRGEGQLEAFAARALAPREGEHWRRWAFVLANSSRYPEAMAALARYTELDPGRSSRDVRAQNLRETLVRVLPGGDLAQRALTREVHR
jgi:hypothetical protein